ncbi:type VII secretion protein EccB [uncultured Corynebacterium sp.]|uniref:type VII secretion protein EccB n=1 Tax=uncultured Corynebacterium sp. TaxID=159447 RepID=UPI0025ED3811|nr:type VII secretion protein EccB [uncultured Corynebacterium sp.]
MRTTGLQVSGVGFLLRRLELALVIGDPRMAHDPLRSQRRAIAVGILLSLLIAGGAVMLALLRPQPAVGEAALAQDEAGGLYVRLGEAFHPVTNVASARLITRQTVEPTRTTFQQIQKFPHGPAIGVPAAPELTQSPAGKWMVCDEGETQGKVVVAPDAKPFTAGVLRSPSGVWLVNGTERTKVDEQTARILGVAENRVSEFIIQRFNRLPDITGKQLRTNAPSGLSKPFHRTGRLLEADGRLFLTQRGGIVELTGPRRTYAEALIGTAPVPTTLAAVLAQPSITAGPRALGNIPERAVTFAPPGRLCAGQNGLVQPVGRFPSLTDATTPGFTGPRGTSVVQTERGVALISETGVRYALGSHADMQALGFRDPVQVPWRLIAALPEGGLLSEANARATTAAMTASARTMASPSGTR